MEEYAIKEISNGWILQGWLIEKFKHTVNLIEEKEIFLPTILAVADILQTWHHQGYAEAAIQAKEKYGGKDGR